MVTYDRKADMAAHLQWALIAETGNGPLAQWARAYRTDLEALLGTNATTGTVEPKKLDYQMSPAESAHASQWAHNHGCPPGIRPDWPDIAVRTKQTGIGVVVELRCKACGREEDVTDYASW